MHSNGLMSHGEPDALKGACPVLRGGWGIPPSARRHGRPAPTLLSPLTEWPVLDGFRRVADQFVLMASPSQQIYGFKGADWARLSAQFPEDTEIRYLEYNYRSTPEIIEASRRLAGPDARHMRPVRPSLHQRKRAFHSGRLAVRGLPVPAGRQRERR